MRIICTVTNDLHQDQRMDRICRTLAAAGHEVTLVGRLLPTSRDLPERPYRQRRIGCRFTAGKAFYVEYNFRLFDELKKWRFDVLCSVDLDTLAAGVALTRSTTQRLVFDAHEWFSETPEVVGRPAIRWFWRRLGKRLVPLTDLRYTVGPKLAEKLAEEYKADFGVIRSLPLGHHRIEAESPALTTTSIAPAPASNSGRKVILYQGVLNPGRGLEQAIVALDDLPECELWIAGAGPLAGSLRNTAAGLRHPDRVRFLGFVAPADLPALTQRAWLGLNLLAGNAPSYYYSLANKALDYLQAGVPSLQMPFPEYETIHQKYGCYAFPEGLTSAAIVTCVHNLIEHPKTYAQLQSGAIRAGRDLIWENEEAELHRLWERVL